MSGAASAQTVSVNAQSNLYSPTGGGIAPTTIAVTGGQTATFSAVGSITYNGGGNFNSPDGYGSAQFEDVTGVGKLSGIRVFQAGALLGVFVNANPFQVTPASLAYNDVASISFTSFAPDLNQVFFIGDGLTGNGTGTAQVFTAPGNATQLLLGFADAPSYQGAPGAYNDNSGDFRVTYALSTVATGAVPEPASWALMIMGFGLAGAAVRRRVHARATAFA